MRRKVEVDDELLISSIRDFTYFEATMFIDRLLASRFLPNILIIGETGTGKSTLAKFLHDKAEDKGLIRGKFVEVNMATIPPELAESELFGHVKWAFTNALRNKRGIIEVAIDGTLLLDEIHHAPPYVQAKLNTLIDKGEFRPVGSETTKSAGDIWFISATTNPNGINDDLRFRLSSQTIFLRSLAGNDDLITGFARKFAAKIASDLNWTCDVPITDDAIEYLCSLPLKGNVRELENKLNRVARLVKSSNGITKKSLSRFLSLDHFPEDFVLPQGTSSAEPIIGEILDKRVTALSSDAKGEVIEKIREAILGSTTGKSHLPSDEELQTAIAQAYAEIFNGCLAPAARQLGIDVRTFSKRLKSGLE